MTSHIRIDKDLADDPRVWRLGSMLFEELASAFQDPISDVTKSALHGVTRNAVLGGLTLLWRYADTHIRSDNTLPTALHELHEVTHLPVTLLRKFPREWMIERDDGTVELPEYTDKNALNAKEKRRAQSRDRVRKWRAKHGIGGNAKRNALPVTESNAGNAPSRTRARTQAHMRVPETETVPETVTVTSHKNGACELPEGPRGTQSEQMQRIAGLKAIYPKGGIYPESDWLEGEREICRRVEEGHTWEVLYQGTERYAAQRLALQSDHVYSPRRFYASKEKLFLQEFPIPRTKAERKQDANVEASLAWLEQQEAKDAAH